MSRFRLFTVCGSVERVLTVYAVIFILAVYSQHIMTIHRAYMQQSVVSVQDCSEWLLEGWSGIHLLSPALYRVLSGRSVADCRWPPGSWGQWQSQSVTHESFPVLILSCC